MAKKWDNIRPCMQTKRRAKRAKRANGQTALVNLVSRERREREKERGRERKRDCGKAGWDGVGCHCNGVCHGPHVPTTPTAEPFATLLLNTLKRANRSRELNS